MAEIYGSMIKKHATVYLSQFKVRSSRFHDVTILHLIGYFQFCSCNESLKSVHPTDAVRPISGASNRDDKCEYIHED